MSLELNLIFNNPEQLGWALLRQVRAVNDAVGYQQLILSRTVFESAEGKRSWFGVNPVLLDVEGNLS